MLKYYSMVLVSFALIGGDYYKQEFPELVEVIKNKLFGVV